MTTVAPALSPDDAGYVETQLVIESVLGGAPERSPARRRDRRLPGAQRGRCVRRGGRDDAGQRLPDRPPVPAAAPRGTRGRQWVTRWQRSSASGSSSSRSSRPASEPGPARVPHPTRGRRPARARSVARRLPRPERRAVGSTPRRSRRHRRARSSTTSTSPSPARRRLARRPPAPPQRRETPPRRPRRRLAERLGVTSREAKVERYYHEMEQGLLPPAGVSDRVLDALGGACSTPPASDSARRVRPRPRRGRHSRRAVRADRGADATTSSPRWRPRPPRRPSPRPATRWTSCSSADERCQARAATPDLTGMVNPYRVLAFAVESGDRQLTDAAHREAVPPGSRIERRMAHVLATRRGAGPRLRL